MTATALSTIERGLPTDSERLAASGSAVSAIKWGVPISTGTTTAVCDVMHTASADYAALKSALATLKLIILDNSSATFALEQSGFCKLDSGEPTSSPTEFSLEVVGWRKWAGALRTCARKTDPIPSSPGARALAQIRQASDLTIEALAPLVGVSRRTLHNWLAGGEISQRNEERLRALAEAVEQIAAVGPETARERLMERVLGSPRIYDLLAEGRYEIAIAHGTGVEPTPRPTIYPKPRTIATPLAARVAALNDKSIPLDGPTNRRLTKRL
jgi:hypothetical protein